MRHKNHDLSDYPTPHQAEMIQAWTSDDIGGFSDKKTVTFNNGAQITVSSDRGAILLAQSILKHAKEGYRNAVNTSLNSPDPVTRGRARLEVYNIEHWIMESRIIGMLSDPDDVKNHFRKVAKRNG